MSNIGKEKKKAMTKALDQIKKKHGKSAVNFLSDFPKLDIETISTGSHAVDMAIGIGGIPKGRIIEIYDPESSGKTTLALQTIAETQKAGGIAAMVDAEHALDPRYAEALGIDLDDLVLSQPDDGEQALEIVEDLVSTGIVDLIVVDSVSALVPKAEISGEMGDSHMGLQARLMSQALRKLTGKTKKSNTSIIFINQIRMKIGIVFGNPETTSGGRALKFYSSVRIDIRRKGSVKEGKDNVGNEVKVKIVKNKVAPPFKVAETRIMFGKGFDKNYELVKIAEELGVITRGGSWYSYGEATLGQGADNTAEEFRNNEELRKEIEEKVFKLAYEKKEDNKEEVEDTKETSGKKA